MSEFKWHDAAIRKALQVYFIMGSNNCLKDPMDVLREAIDGGITLFQFREKGTGALSGEPMVELAYRMRELCRRHDVPFIVNDDVELAITVDADGVHVGQEDEGASAVRERIGSRLLGVSAYNMGEAGAAICSGADYLGVGPLFSTQTKEDAKAASGLQVLTEMRGSGIHIPIVGIGGITAANAGQVIHAGADGVSFITAISHADDPTAAAREMRQAVHAAGGSTSNAKSGKAGGSR
ncbi:thiamine-phosphate pyrophosphorylase [Paenibacillus taihuensis]|uniref:Thiamine-phosphate synthase n=1 Tax=Paenibacillus taihuensis TaxID=1156355 RepID=A0A3D9S7B1_9BACL|nr:thiamine phosphate synthase [Paenibacillus taihuensis]REE89060.1 thiamine-phosphate pyrophosphorylase [Paenibacillus taihuensis]